MMVGHVPGAVLLHELHVLVVHEGAVLDGIHAANDRSADRFGAVRVGRDGEAIVVRGSDDRADLIQGELRIVAARAFDRARRRRA